VGVDVDRGNGLGRERGTVGIFVGVEQDIGSIVFVVARERKVVSQ
jgi:hypothetical protein